MRLGVLPRDAVRAPHCHPYCPSLPLLRWITRGFGCIELILLYK